MYPVTQTSSSTLKLSGSIKTSTVRQRPDASEAPQIGQPIRPNAYPSSESRALHSAGYNRDTQRHPIAEIYRRQSPAAKASEPPHSASRVERMPQPAARVSGRPISPSAVGVAQRPRTGPSLKQTEQVPTAYQEYFTQRPLTQTPVSSIRTISERPVGNVQPLVRKTSSSHARVTASIKMSQSGTPYRSDKFTKDPSRMATRSRTVPRSQGVILSPASFNIPISSERRFVPEQLQLDHMTESDIRTVSEARKHADLSPQGDQRLSGVHWSQYPPQSWEEPSSYYERFDDLQEMKKWRESEKESDILSAYSSEWGETEKLPEFWELSDLSPIKAFDEAVMTEIDRRQAETYILDTAMTPRSAPSKDKDGRSHMAVHSSLSAIDIDRSLRFTRETELMEVIDKFIQAEQACHFDGAIKAAETAAAAAPPEMAEEAAAEGARNYQAHIMDTIQEKLPGFRPLELVGYVGVTKVHATPEEEQLQEKSNDTTAHQ